MDSILNALQVSAQETSQKVMICDWQNPAVYAEWLSQTYHFVKHTTRLLAMGASVAEVAVEDDLHYFFLKHLPEEQKHDLILIHDVKKLGQNLSPSSFATSQFVENQKKDMKLNGCMAHMGYMLYLENLSIAVGPELYNRVSQYHNPKACHFLKTHTQDDVDHVRGALEFCMGLNQKQKTTLLNSILSTHEGYKKILSEILAKHQPVNIETAS